LIGCITLGTNDLPRAAACYDTLLAEVGITRLMEFGGRGCGWAAPMDKPMLCVFKPYDGRPPTVGNGVMVGIAVDSRDKVDRIHKKALELGGTDEGPVSMRAEGGDGFCAGDSRDLVGNKLDVFCYGGAGRTVDRQKAVLGLVRHRYRPVQSLLMALQE